MVAHGQVGVSRVIGIPLNEINMPEGIVMGALVRDDEVLHVHHDTVIQEGDHVIMFLLDKRLIPEVERLFHAVDSI
jgi:trk system potassium uptake protein TrkA